MNKYDKEILKKAVDSNEGQISPATMINSYAGGNQAIVERLVSSGYLERVYQFRSNVDHATYSIIFYAVTEKGLMQFSTVIERLWFNFTNDAAAYVGLISVLISLTMFISTLIFSAMQNNRENADFELRTRPYLVISQVDTSAFNGGIKYRLHLKNVGVLPAKIEGGSIACDNHGRVDFADKNLVGNGEELTFDFNVSTSADVMCDYSVKYSILTQDRNENAYGTTYKFKSSTEGMLLPVDAILR